MRHQEQPAIAFALTVQRLAQAAYRSKPQPHSDTPRQPFGRARVSHPLFQTSRTDYAQLRVHSNAGPPPRSQRVTAARKLKRKSSSPPRDNYALRPASIPATTSHRLLLQFESPLDQAARVVSTPCSAGYWFSTRPQSHRAASTIP